MFLNIFYFALPFVPTQEVMDIAAKRFVVEVGFAPSDGGLYLLAQMYVGLASVKQFDPDLQTFIQYVQFFQSGTSNGVGKEMALGGLQRFARVLGAFKKVGRGQLVCGSIQRRMTLA